MTFETFKTTLLDSLTEYYGEEYSLSIRPVQKNNQVILDGLMIQKNDCNISPTIYLNSYYTRYLNGAPLFEILEDIKNLYAANHPMDNMDLEFFTDFEQAKDHICMKLIHRGKNEEMLKETPYVAFLDLAIVFYYLFPLYPGENATILINQSYLAQWQVSVEELFHLALENTPKLLPYYLDDIFSILQDFNDLLSYSTDHAIPLYVLTNSEKLFGAAAILYPDLMDTLCQRMDCDFLLFPSSIHEMLLLPVQEGEDHDDYHSMIEEINQTQLLPEEILSDHAYYYSRKAQSFL